MGWNVRRSKKLFPGVRLNLSKNGLGVSIGPAHSKISFSPKGRVTTNLGIPGTGIRYTKRIDLDGEHKDPKAHPVKQANAENTPKDSLSSPLEGSDSHLSPEDLASTTNTPAGSKGLTSGKVEARNLPEAAMIHLDIDTEPRLPSESVRKYIVISKGNEANPTWHPDLFDIDALKTQAHLGQLERDSVIIDSYTGQHHNAEELLGSYLF